MLCGVQYLRLSEQSHTDYQSHTAGGGGGWHFQYYTYIYIVLKVPLPVFLDTQSPTFLDTHSPTSHILALKSRVPQFCDVY